MEFVLLGLFGLVSFGSGIIALYSGYKEYRDFKNEILRKDQ